MYDMTTGLGCLPLWPDLAMFSRHTPSAVGHDKRQ